MDDILMRAMALEEGQSTDDVLMSAVAEDSEYDDILVHYGVPDMEWGKRRYQNPDGSLTPLGRIHYGIGKARARRTEKKAKRAEKAEAARVKKVERLARSGNVDKIYKNRGIFTKDELYDAISRAEKMSAFQKTGRKAQAKAAALARKSDKDRQRAKPVDPKSMAKSKITLDKVAKTAKTLAELYGSYKVISGAVNAATGKHTLPDFNKETFSDWVNRKNETSKDTNKPSGESKQKTEPKTNTGSKPDDKTKQTTASQPKKESGPGKADDKATTATSQKPDPSPKWKKVANDDRGIFPNAGRRVNEPFVDTYAWEKVSDNDRGYSFGKTRMSDDVINTIFDTVTGSYGVPKTDWASAMMVPVSSIPSPDYSPRRWR